MTRVPAAGVILALALAAPAAAQADVLINVPDTSAVCGDLIKVGVWAQPGTTGSRSVSISAQDRVTGRIVARRTVTAMTSHWRYWFVAAPTCHTTTIAYRSRAADGRSETQRFTVHFRSEGV